MEHKVDAKWIKGINSLFDQSLLSDGEYAWGQNIDNSGGVISTRQGFNSIGQINTRLPNEEPKGMAVFKDKNGKTTIVIAVGDNLYSCQSPFNTDFQLLSTGFYADAPVIFCRAYVSFILNADNSTTLLEVPYPALIMQNGIEQAKYWDGATVLTSDPSTTQPGIPVGTWMQWSGGRLWVASDNLLHASDLGNPLSFYEETAVAPIGPLSFEDTITGLNQTPNLETLLVCTDYNTSVVTSTVTDRNQWSQTAGFQRVFLPGVGCAAGKSFVRHWGVVWWYSHGGLVQLDQAIQTYRTSRIRYRDQEMLRSKANLSDDVSGICSGSFGNYMIVSVPSGDGHNAHSWVINQRVLDLGVDPYYGDPSEWASNWTGIHPMEYVQAIIKGQQRLFCLSREVSDDGLTVFPVVWELFTGERQDRFNDHVYQPPALLETRDIGFSEDLKEFKYAEIDISELIGKAHLDVFVASRRGGYYQILSKDLVASKGSINSNAIADFVTQTTRDYGDTDHTVFVQSTAGSLDAPAYFNINGRFVQYTGKTSNTFTVPVGQLDVLIKAGASVTQPQFFDPPTATAAEIQSFIPQRRIVKTSSWILKPSDQQSPVESNLPQNIDRGFSLLLQWTGRLTITGLRIFYEKWDEQQHGVCEDNEENAQFLSESGTGGISGNPEFLTTDSARLKSQYLRVITPRRTDVMDYTPIPSDGEV